MLEIAESSEVETQQNGYFIWGKHSCFVFIDTLVYNYKDNKNRYNLPPFYQLSYPELRLLARSRYLLFKSPDKWSEKQKPRAKILFKEYPDMQKAYSLTHSLRMIFKKTQ